MTTPPFAPRVPLPELFPGQAVHVNARCAWLPATVTSVTHRTIGISLPMTTTGTLTRTVAPWVVQPADGYRLAPVRDLRRGDEVAAADGSTRTIAGTPWQGRDGWWVITYTNKERATLPPTAVLRLPDPHRRSPSTAPRSRTARHSGTTESLFLDTPQHGKGTGDDIH